MGEIPILQDIVVIFGFSVVVLFICHRLGIPSIVGFLVTGLLIGPSSLGIVRSIHEVEVLAEIGVILLLFSIGIEFSFRSLLRSKRLVLMGGTLQVLLTIALAYLVAVQFGQGASRAFFIGCLMALSSTAIVLRLLQERVEIASPHGRVVLSILIFQDIIIVPMMIFTPLLAGAESAAGASPLMLVLKTVGVIVLVILAARYVVPGILYQITRTQSRELFLLSVVVIGMAVAWLTSKAGLSLGLGAFLAGLVISESEYSHRALEGILPFKEVFTSFFFVSVGMLLDISFFLENPILIAAGALLVLLVKSGLAAGVALLLGMSSRVALIAGLSLGQVGEFSFILSRVGLEFNLIDGDIYQKFIAVSIITMGATPFIISAAPGLAERMSDWPFLRKYKSGSYIAMGDETKVDTGKLDDHLVIIGFGINGRNVARAAKASNIDYRVIEMNPDTVNQERKKGEPIFYGDAAGEAALHQAAIERARILVITIADPSATRRITALARRMNPRIHIVVRTRFVQEMKPLYDLGADNVIPEEFETSVEIFTQVLMKYLVPREEIDKFIDEVRSDSYQMFRGLSRRTSSVSDLKRHLSDIDVCSLRVDKDAELAGKTLMETDLRRKHGITVIAIQRGDRVITSPDGPSRIEADDMLYVLGDVEHISRFQKLIKADRN
ncbi:MAG: potassium transporter KefB [candidate division Zixibacteria bacterium]|nr:potassium transporter KefB [candidate division Zixibacteria bacterium]NIR66361.1 potassium transporter KefB [candidate division Zixibacteria bacterium]NIS17982.1 potassium transporter KefB [candidate division Zixibacteria bacterium]NIS47963.1 potassium transporter KefB [candidate division Zixibacteria bacterium]NIT54265.1 potassium transporter KefB [candidate division Zixibacteria bacterium]